MDKFVIILSIIGLMFITLLVMNKCSDPTKKKEVINNQIDTVTKVITETVTENTKKIDTVFISNDSIRTEIKIVKQIVEKEVERIVEIVKAQDSTNIKRIDSLFLHYGFIKKEGEK